MVKLLKNDDFGIGIGFLIIISLFVAGLMSCGEAPARAGGGYTVIPVAGPGVNCYVIENGSGAAVGGSCN